MIGASDAKVTILPLLIAALGTYAAWTLLVSRRVPVAVWAAAGSPSPCRERSGRSSTAGTPACSSFDPFGDVNLMPAVQLVKGDLATNLAGFPGKDVALDAFGVVFGVVGLLAAPLVGIAWVLRYSGLPHPTLAGLAPGAVRYRDGPLVRLRRARLARMACTSSSTASSAVICFRPRGSGRPGSAARRFHRGAWLRGRCARRCLRGGCRRADRAALRRSDLFTGPRANALTYLFRYAGLRLP